MADEATCTHIDEVELCPTTPTTTVAEVVATYPANACEPGTYPASVEAVGDASQCVDVDPCSPDGTTYWNAQPCVALPVAGVGVLPSTGPSPYGPTIGVLGVAVILFGTLAVRAARRPRCTRTPGASPPRRS